MARRPLAVVGALTALTLLGCGTGGDEAAPADPPTPAPATAVPTSVPTSVPGGSDEPSPSLSAPSLSATSLSATAVWDPVASPGSAAVVDEDTGQAIQVQPVPTWDDTARGAAAAAAETVMAAFARPDLDVEAWWAGVEPLLSPQAAQDYAYVDPASVPATEVTGPAVLVQDTSAYVAGVQVPTDAGDYLVVLSRADGAAPWLVERVTPPDEVG